MKVIMNKMASADSYCVYPRGAQRSKVLHFRSQVERLLYWLAGIDNHTFSVAEKVISRNLPSGIKIEQATAEELGRATKAAMDSHNELSEEI